MTSVRHVESTVDLRSSHSQVVAVLRDAPKWLFGTPAAGGCLAEVTADLRRGATVRQYVLVDVGTPEDSAGRTRVAITWTPVGRRRLLPSFSGAAIVTADGDDARLTLEGTYRPPFGLLGALWDRLAGRRVAAHTVDVYVRELGARIDRAVEHRALSGWRPAALPDLFEAERWPT